MKKKILVWILGAVLAASMTGCGSGGTDQTADSVSVEKEAAESLSAEQEPDTTESTHGMSEAAEASLQSLVAEAKESGAAFAAAYIGFYSGGGETSVWENTLADEEYAQTYSFLEEIPEQDQFAYEGEEVYCIVPLEDATEIIVSEYTAVDDEGNTDLIGEELFRSDDGMPVLLSCNVSDIMANVSIEVKTTEGSVIFQPGLSLKDGSVVLPEEAWDFSQGDSASQADDIDIYDLYSIQEEYSDSVGNYWSCSYKLPCIEGPDTDYLQMIREQVDEIYEQDVQQALSDMEQGMSLNVSRISYEWDYYDGIYSLKIVVPNDWGQTEYHIYNFDGQGQMVTNEDVLAAVGWTEDTFVSNAYGKLDAYTSPNPEYDYDADILEQLEACREKTLDEENLNSGVPIYLSHYGTISFVAQVYSVAGADSYDHLFVLIPDEGFADEELCNLALNYYESVNGYRPGYAASSSASDYEVDIQLYDSMEDHNSTADWYTLDRLTGKGTNMMEEQIDVTVN